MQYAMFKAAIRYLDIKHTWTSNIQLNNEIFLTAKAAPISPNVH